MFSIGSDPVVIARSARKNRNTRPLSEVLSGTFLHTFLRVVDLVPRPRPLVAGSCSTAPCELSAASGGAPNVPPRPSA